MSCKDVLLKKPGWSPIRVLSTTPGTYAQSVDTQIERTTPLHQATFWGLKSIIILVLYFIFFLSEPFKLIY